MRQTTIEPLNQLEEMLKQRKFLQGIIEHYRTEYKKVRLMVREKKRELKALNLKISQATKPDEEQK